MTHPTELERPKDSLAKVVADIRTWHGGFSEDICARIERLDAEMRKEYDKLHARCFAALSLVDGCTLIGDLQDAAKDMATKLAELDACKSLLNDPRVRALFPGLKDGTVLASCSGGVG